MQNLVLATEVVNGQHRALLSELVHTGRGSHVDLHIVAEAASASAALEALKREFKNLFPGKRLPKVTRI